MARARNIKPGFFSNDLLAACTPLARLLFIGLWTIADRRGIVEDRPMRIKGSVLPYDNCDCDALLAELHTGSFIIRYEEAGHKCLYIPNFEKHQRPHPNEPESLLPHYKIRANRDKTRTARDKIRQVRVKTVSEQENVIANCASSLNPFSLNTSSLNPSSLKEEDSTPVEVLPDWFHDQDFLAAWNTWDQFRREKRKPLTPTMVSQQHKLLARIGKVRAVAAIEYTVAMGWQGLREPEGTIAVAPTDPCPTDEDLANYNPYDGGQSHG